MKNFSNLIKEANNTFGIQITDSDFDMLELFAEQMAESNNKYNLTGLKTPEDIRKKHFLDSISCVPVIKDLKKDRAIDVGTGAGFPGLVIKIVFKEIDFTLVDSVGKKTAFIEEMIRLMDIQDVDVITDRAEAFGQDPNKRESYDLVFARALAKMPVMLEYLLPLAKIGGYIIAQRGTNSILEVQENELLIKRLGGEIEEVIPVVIPDLTERYIIKIKKISPTPAKYPRRVGTPKKNPLQNI